MDVIPAAFTALNAYSTKATTKSQSHQTAKATQPHDYHSHHITKNRSSQQPRRRESQSSHKTGKPRSKKTGSDPHGRRSAVEKMIALTNLVETAFRREDGDVTVIACARSPAHRDGSEQPSVGERNWKRSEPTKCVQCARVPGMGKRERATAGDGDGAPTEGCQP